MKKELLKIAKESSYAVKVRGNLERRYNDGENFLAISVWSLKEMLEKAYELGKQEGKNKAKGPHYFKGSVVLLSSVKAVFTYFIWLFVK